MNKMTSVRMSGIKSGYWTVAKKDELTQRLGELEHKLPGLLEQVCDLCGNTGKICDTCRMNTVMLMLGEGEFEDER